MKNNKLKLNSISRLELDINAAFYEDQKIREPSEIINKSLISIRSESFKGDVILTKNLINSVELIINESNDNKSLRNNALELYSNLRLTAPILAKPNSYRDRQALTTIYDAPTSLAYLAGLMPSIYAATLNVLTMTKNRLNLSNQINQDNNLIFNKKEKEESKIKTTKTTTKTIIIPWEPERIIDYGSGTSSTAFAFQEVFGERILSGPRKGQPREYIGLEWSKSMVELASKLLGNLKSTGMLGPEVLETVDGSTSSGAENSIIKRGGELPIKLDARVHQLSIPAQESALAKLNLSTSTYSPHPNGKKTLAIAAFALADQGTKERRKDFITAMWDSNAEVIVLVDRGTPGGSRMILEAREHLLMLGRRNAKREVYEGEVGPAKGCFVLAPCPHDGDCPLFHSTKQWCHFSQRVRSPPFLRHTKHSTKGETDAVFSYVVIQRGTRPPALVHSISSPESSETETGRDSTISTASVGSELGSELSWPRIIAPPRKRSGHVLLDVCAASGVLEQHTIPKSQGRQPYYDARKVNWGDSFPHAPKNKAKLMEVWTTEVKESIKGIKLKVGKKESRRVGLEKRGRVTNERDGEGEGMEVGDGDGKDGVRDYELEVAEDGSLRIVN